MGITGLLPFVKDSCRPTTLRNFSGSTVAIDAYSWLHKGAFSCAEKLVKGEKTDGYVLYCIKQLNMILDLGLKPIMVFDGCNLCSKAVTEKKRRENRDKTRQKGKEYLCEGKIKEARECFQRCVDVTPEMAREVVMACKKKGVDCIVAPYEADAQLAYLDKIGMAQLIITEDSDLILFGCNRILFKMDSCGGGLLYEKENLPKSFGAKAMKFSFEKFRYMCILSGCDYLPSLPGIGLAKAYKFFTLTNNPDVLNVLPKLPSYLKMPKLVVTDEYKESFIKANNTFLYQLVFCPQKKSMVPLNSYPEDLKPNDMEYAGKYFADDIANQIAKGNINVKTMKEFDYNEDLTDFDDKSAVWSSQGSLEDNTSSKVKLSAFKFNTPKPKLPVPKKRQFTERVEDLGYKKISDEELFAMYRLEPKKSCTDDSFSENESTVKEEESFEDCSSPPQTSPPPQLPFNPFKRIVKSRFFSSESQQNKDEKSTSSSIASTDEKDFLSTSLGSASEEIELPEESDVNIAEVCNFSLELQIGSPKKDNKENVNRFAKRKSSVSPNKQESPSKKLKNYSCLDIIDNESDVATSSVFSLGGATNILDALEGEIATPISVNRLSKFKQKPKRLITTRIHDFKWSKGTNSSIKLSTSLGSDGNLLNESCECSPEADTEGRGSFVSCEASPYFQTPSQNSMNCSTSSAMSETEDADLPEISVVYTSRNEAIPTSSKGTSNNVLKTIDNKSKPGPCRTLGLSKTKKKNSLKVPRKETLLNFNFIRQPKSEVSTTV